MPESQTPIYKRLAILGVGLMGGSLAVAAKRAGVVESVVGWGRTAANLQAAVERGYIDSWTDQLEQALDGADCVVVATPTQFAEQLMVDVLRRVPVSTTVTDVASVKANLVAALSDAFGEIPSNVILGHPIAGSEKSGVDAVDAELYQRHKVILIDSPERARMTALKQLWEAVGAEVSLMNAAQHDAVLALTSHLPHLLSYALVEEIAGSDLEENVFAYAAGGLRDFSRVAGSDPDMWSQILLANREQILAGLSGYENQLARLRDAMLAGDGEQLREILAHAQHHRNRFADAYAVRTAGKNKSKSS